MGVLETDELMTCFVASIEVKRESFILYYFKDYQSATDLTSALLFIDKEVVPLIIL